MIVVFFSKETQIYEKTKTQAFLTDKSQKKSLLSPFQICILREIYTLVFFYSVFFMFLFIEKNIKQVQK